MNKKQLVQKCSLSSVSQKCIQNYNVTLRAAELFKGDRWLNKHRACLFRGFCLYKCYPTRSPIFTSLSE